MASQRNSGKTAEQMTAVFSASTRATVSRLLDELKLARLEGHELIASDQMYHSYHFEMYRLQHFEMYRAYQNEMYHLYHFQMYRLSRLTRAS